MHTHSRVSHLRSHRVLYPNHSDAGQLRHYFCLVFPVWLWIARQVTVCNADGPQPLTCHWLNHLLINYYCSSSQKTRPWNLTYILLNSPYTRMSFPFQHLIHKNWIKLSVYSLKIMPNDLLSTFVGILSDTAVGEIPPVYCRQQREDNVM